MPMRRLASNTVLWGFWAAWLRAASPTSRSWSVNATMLGVVRLPTSFSMICTRPSCHTPTQLQQAGCAGESGRVVGGGAGGRQGGGGRPAVARRSWRGRR